MSSRIYDDWIQAYIAYTAESEAPTKFHFWTAVSVIAGALRRNVWIEQGYFQWTPNFYIVFVSPPGIVSKSTTMSIGMDLLRRVPGIVFGPDALTWQALAQAMAESTEMILMPDGNYHSMSALTIASSEFGNLLNPNDREMVDFLVALWDSRKGVWRKATKTQGSDSIENPWINIVACTTPAWIAGNFPEYLIGGGFTSRCIFVYAEEKRHLSAYPSASLPPDFKENSDKLVQDLERISMLRGVYELSKDAMAWGQEWYEKLHRHRPAFLDNNKFAGYLARKQTHIHKLAMIIAAAKSDDLIIKPEHLIIADTVVTALEEDLPKVFYTIGQTPAARYFNTVISFMRAYRKVPHNRLVQVMSASMGKHELEEALQMAISGGMILARQEGNELFYIYQESKV